MESPMYEKDEPDMDKIYVDLEQLKKRIDRFICMVEGENAEEPRRKKIKALTTKTKHLLLQHKEVKEELQYYESMYKTALSKNAKTLKRELKRDKSKLENLKEKCRNQGMQVEIAMMEMNHKGRSEKTKRPIVVERVNKKASVFKGKYPTIKDKIKIKMRTKNKLAGRKIFKQNSPRLSDNIKIQIQQNKETGQRKLVFFNTSKANERFSNMVQKNEHKSTNFRECRIILQKLTDEQAKKYTGEKKSQSRNSLHKSPEASPENGKRKSPGAKLNWQIRIPRAVLEESQNQPQNVNSNASDNAMKNKRKRSTDK